MDLNRFLGYPWAGGYFVGPGFHVVPPDPWTHHISILNSLDSGNPNKDMHCTVNNNAILVCMDKSRVAVPYFEKGESRSVLLNRIGSG